MPSLSFQEQFVKAVENGVAQLEGRVLPFPDKAVKRQTIRAKRQHPFKVDDALFLFTAMRTKDCRRLGEATCESARTVWIEQDFVDVGGIELDPPDIEQLAIADGFESAQEMMRWFKNAHGFPFFGQLIEW